MDEKSSTAHASIVLHFFIGFVARYYVFWNSVYSSLDQWFRIYYIGYC